MTHLIPEKRMNKHGVPVTKHVLPPAAAPATKGSLPSPKTVEPQRSDWGTLEPVVYEYIALRTDDPDNMIRRIGDLDPVLRAQVTDALLSGDEYSSYTALTVMEQRDDFKAEYIMGTLDFHRAIVSVHLETASNKPLTMRGQVGGMLQRFSIEYFGRHEGEVTSERLKYFKADIISDEFNFRHMYPVNFERYAALGQIAEQIDLVERALPAMVKTNSAIRHWRQENRTSTDAGALGASDLLAIAKVVEDRPDSIEHFYQYARDRGFFDVEGFTEMINTPSPSLYQGVL